MSIQAVAWVLENSESRGTARLVLIALANRVNPDHNWECWPAMRGLAKEAAVASTSTVQAALATLAELGEIEIVSHGDRRHPGRYRMTFCQCSPTEHSESNTVSSPERTQRSAQTEQNRNEPEGTVTPEPHGSARRSNPESDRVTKVWWEEQNPRPMQKYVAVRGIVDLALRSGHDPDRVLDALRSIADDPPVVSWKLEKALAANRTGQHRTSGYGPPAGQV